MLGSNVDILIAACSKRFNWERCWHEVMMDVDDHAILCPRSRSCLAGALLILPVAESTGLPKR